MNTKKKVIALNGICPLCKKESHMYLLGEDVNKFTKYYCYFPQCSIQEVFSDKSAAIREYIRSQETNRFCHDCMEIMFGRTDDAIKDDWDYVVDDFGIEEVEDEAEIERYIAELDTISKYLQNNEITEYRVDYKENIFVDDYTTIYETDNFAIYTIKGGF